MRRLCKVLTKDKFINSKEKYNKLTHEKGHVILLMKIKVKNKRI